MDPTSKSAPRIDPVSFFSLMLATWLGGFVRLANAARADFPLVDGGLFYKFIQDLRSANYALPTQTSYNSANIPFNYPPLSFYMAGLMSELFNWPTLDIIRLLPPIISILTIPAFYLLIRSLLPAKIQSIFALFSFALLPTAFDWLVVGGGLSRSFGFLFSILTLHQVYLLYKRGNKRFIFSSIIFASLTVLSHPVVAWFTVYSSLILFLFFGFNKNGVLRSAIVATGVLIATSPWWATVILRHGLTPLLSATNAGFRTWYSLLTPFLFIHTNEPFLYLQAAIALFGLFFCLHNRNFFIPAWLAAVFIFEPRLSATYSVIPMTMLVGIGLDRVILPGIAGQVGKPDLADAGADPSAQLNRKSIPINNYFAGRIPKIALGFFLVYALMSAYLSAPADYLHTDQRKAMEWIKGNTPVDIEFLVISGITGAGIDYVSEWFPALTNRTSSGTPQGYEWLPNHEFYRRWQLHGELQTCAESNVTCLENWADLAGCNYTHVFISKPQTKSPGELQPLYNSLKSSSNFTLIYENSSASIFAKNQEADP
jgi:hypothetical protein